MNARLSFLQPPLVAITLALTPAAILHGQAPPTEETEVRDLSETPIRKVGASIHLPTPGWNIQEQKPNGPAVAVHFGGPAAPLDQVGKTLKPFI